VPLLQGISPAEATNPHMHCSNSGSNKKRRADHNKAAEVGVEAGIAIAAVAAAPARAPPAGKEAAPLVTPPALPSVPAPAPAPPAPAAAVPASAPTAVPAPALALQAVCEEAAITVRFLGFFRVWQVNVGALLYSYYY